MKTNDLLRRHIRASRSTPGTAAIVAVLALFAPGTASSEYGDVILNNHSGSAEMRPVIFPHWLHRMRFNCSVCHDEVGFKMRSGADDIKMEDINNGKYCGACHNGKFAWGPEKCNYCHNGLPGLQTGIKGGDSTDGPGKW
jgi:c(7)-type cytochrome triheme protein